MEREQTFGEKAVGLSFNPSGMSDVDKLKKLYANIIDHMNDFRKGYIARGDSPEMVRLYSIAITEAQTAQMWAVKAVTWRG
ncbi:MAG: hypothetical protein LAO18_22225 [Acidobacteriia bacterium]|nr:hypothetical protein [Terriglobia bacterium]